MEKLTLKPQFNEIIVNSGATEGAVDLFCYAPDDAPSQGLGSLSVVGHRENESGNMGYMVSLIAALARREYYSQPSTPPREAFARTLRKANEVVEEFFRSSDVKLSVGIVAVAGSQIMVSKLDKFKILLAREGQVIDILSNVLLFSKEHTEKRRFSSIIHGSVQAGDRILAFVPTRAVTSRERNLKTWFLKLPQAEFAERVTHIGQEHASFAAAMLHIDVAQTSEPAQMPSPQPPELSAPTNAGSSLTPSLAAQSSFPPQTSPVAWSPRQQSAMSVGTASRPHASVDSPSAESAETEMPRIISSEFSLGTRRTTLSRFLSRIKFVRLDGRGKAVLLAVVVTLITGGVFVTKSLLIVSPQQQQNRQALSDIRRTVENARTTSANGKIGEARAMLLQALTTVEALGTKNTDAVDISATILSTMDSIDHAQSVLPTLLASPAPDADAMSFATWASPSQTVRVGGVDSRGGLWVATLDNGALTGRASLGSGTADLLIGWRSSVLTLDTTTRTVTRIIGDQASSYVIPVQETILDAVEFGDSLYVLTDKTILKVSDLDTVKPVTKRWLETDEQLTTGAARLYVDGSLYTMGRDGQLTTYYKGKRKSQFSVPLSPSGIWRLLPGPDNLFAVAVGSARRVYLVDRTDGSLVRTLKVDSQLPFTHVAAGPDGSVLALTSEGKLWSIK